MFLKAFVIGHPIAHSRSPHIHGHWLERYAIAGRYDAIDVSHDQLELFCERLRAGEFAGGNVTIPHKQAVFQHCDWIDPLARSIGAVNTLVVREGEIEGRNTDYLGFLGNLDASEPGWDHGLESAIVLGAGGAARAVLVALASRGVKNIHVLNRTYETAKALADTLDGPYSAHNIDEFDQLAPSAGLLVNTTSIGMNGTRFTDLALDRLPAGGIVNDIVYTPLLTPLLADAAALQLRTVDGLGMLLHQAAPGFAAWFGVTPQIDQALRAKIEATLGQ